jgi:lipopolysaccharide export system ATP-binding protein
MNPLDPCYRMTGEPNHRPRSREPSVLDFFDLFRRRRAHARSRQTLAGALGVSRRFDIMSWFRRRPAPAHAVNVPAGVRRHDAHDPAPLSVRRSGAETFENRRHWSEPDPEELTYAEQAEYARDFDAEPAPRWDERDRWPEDHEGSGAAPHHDPERRPLWDESDTEAPGRYPEQRDDGYDSALPRHRHWAEAEREQPAQQGYLAVEGVEKSFGNRQVVKGVSLYVRRGEAVGLLGPNGAGKTTVFYMITGLIKADRGRVELEGHDITPLPMYQRGRLGIGYLAQEASIFRGMTVEQNIRAILEVVEPNRKKREEELDALLEEFNITRLRKTPAPALSGGERRRVEIARALASRPTYMLLDEPFAGIDPIAVGDIQALVRHLTRRGIGVLITDHNVRETLGLTDRAYIIYSGQVLMEGLATDIVNDPDVRRLYLGEEFRM